MCVTGRHAVLPVWMNDWKSELGPIRLAKTVVVFVIGDEPEIVDLTVMVLESAGRGARGTTGKAGVNLAVDHSADIFVRAT